MDVKAHHRAACSLIDINFINIQRVDGKDITVGLTLRWCRAAVSCLTEIGTGLDRFFGQFRLT